MQILVFLNSTDIFNRTSIIFIVLIELLFKDYSVKHTTNFMLNAENKGQKLSHWLHFPSKWLSELWCTCKERCQEKTGK